VTHSSLVVIAALVATFATVSRRVERVGISAPLFFVTAGVLVGGEVLGWIDAAVTTGTVRLLAEATLALVLFSDASRIDLRALGREYALPARLLGIGLPLTIAAGALLALVLLPQLTWAEALVLAVVLAPTDAGLGQAVVTDARLASRIRQGLNVESGLNDGICVPLLFLALGLAEAESGLESDHAVVTLLAEKIGYGLLVGALAGIVCAGLVRLARAHGLAEDAWLQLLPIAAAAIAYGGAEWAGGSGFIAAFVAGLIFGAARERAGAPVTVFMEEAGELLMAVTFLVFGAGFVGPLLAKLDWRTALYAVLSLTVVRMVPVAISLLGSGARPPTVAFLGWFGPRGLATIVFAGIIVDESSLPGLEPILVASMFAVVLSVYAHGLSAGPLTARYARWYHAHEERPLMESEPVPAQRWRRRPSAA
jgi:NhaP-type Na+/H+ or K+/H+ antiporter